MPLIQREIQVEHIAAKGPQGRFLLGTAEELLPKLMEEYSGAVKCIYLDPPFLTGNHFVLRQRVGAVEWKRNNGSLTLPAYQDFRDRDAYLHMMKGVLQGARALLREDGMLFLHVDWRTNAHLRLLLDEIFGEENFLNEIIWAYQSGGRAKNFFSRKHDDIYFYRKSPAYDFHLEAVMEKRQAPRSSHMRQHVDADGRVYRSIRSGGKTYTYYDDDPVAPSDVWFDLSHIQQRDPERTGYDTQKPVSLLNRIVRCSTQPGELVMDLFAGSSTTLVAAARNGCPFVGVDASPVTLGLARRRLSDIADLTLEAPPETAAAQCEAILEPGVGVCRMELKAFHADAPVERGFDGLDMVDSWALGYIRDGAFHAVDQSIRTNRAPEICPSLNAPVISDQLSVRVSDVFGRNFYFSWIE